LDYENKNKQLVSIKKVKQKEQDEAEFKSSTDANSSIEESNLNVTVVKVENSPKLKMKISERNQDGEIISSRMMTAEEFVKSTPEDFKTPTNTAKVQKAKTHTPRSRSKKRSSIKRLNKSQVNDDVPTKEVLTTDTSSKTRPKRATTNIIPKYNEQGAKGIKVGALNVTKSIKKSV
jgi:hypothetical protein